MFSISIANPFPILLIPISNVDDFIVISNVGALICIQATLAAQLQLNRKDTLHIGHYLDFSRPGYSHPYAQNALSQSTHLQLSIDILRQ